MKCKYCGTESSVIINTDYEVPYVAGYSEDGHTIYIDRRLPSHYIDSTHKRVHVHRYLIIHEVTEKALKDELGMTYNEAHSLAMGTQAFALTRDGINFDEYYAFQQKYVNFDIKPQDFDDVPPDLDISPYIEDGLTSVVNKIKQLQGKGE